MRRSWLLAGAALVLAAAIVAIFLWPASEPGAPPRFAGAIGAFQTTGQPAPDLSFTNAAGETLRLSQLRGKVVVLNLWATWCAPCVHEMPALDRLQADLGGADLEVVALSSDRTGAAAVEPFFREHGLRHLRVYLDPQSVATRALQPRGLPTTLVIDRQGVEVGRLEGAAEWDSAAAKALLQHYLEREP